MTTATHPLRTGTGETIHARALRLHQLRKLAHQTDHLETLHATTPLTDHDGIDALADEAATVAGYATDYADSLAEDRPAATRLAALLNEKTDPAPAFTWAATHIEIADEATDMALRLGVRTLA